MKILASIRFGRATLVGLALSALLSACGGSGDGSTAESGSTHLVSSDGPPIHVPSGPPPRRMVIKELVKGKGPPVPPIARVPKAEISTMYKVADYKTGQVLEDRWALHNPFTVPFKPGLVVPAWERGIQGMRKGGLRELIVPSAEAYHSGARVFVVELRSLKMLNGGTAQSGTANKSAPKTKKHIGHSGKRVPVPTRKDEMSKREIAKLPPLTIAKQSGPPPHHLEAIDLRKGWGTTLTKNDAAYVRYYVVSYPEAAKHSQTGLYGPRSFGMNEVVKGWEVALPGMKVGGRRELILPPKYVYPRWRPSWGYTPFVDIYLVDLLGVEHGGADQHITPSP